MALVASNKVFVGVARRADEALGKKDDWYPQSYVTLDIDGSETYLSPSAAKDIARALKAAAEVVQPPRRRKAS